MITNTRRAPRLQIPALIPVRDRMTDSVIGRLSNVSETGMLVIASEPLLEDALYQLQFPIPDRRGGEIDIDVGVHLPKQTLWGRIVCPPSFRSAFKAHFSMTPARLAASPITREINAGSKPAAASAVAPRSSST
jgi:hypothetical protein